MGGRGAGVRRTSVGPNYFIFMGNFEKMLDPEQQQ